MAGTGIHEYWYYDIRIRPVNMWVLKILVPVIHRYPFPTHCEFYSRIFADMILFDIPIIVLELKTLK